MAGLIYNTSIGQWIPFRYILHELWQWILDAGSTLAILLVCALLVPRIGRMIIRLFTRNFSEAEEETKTRLALVGTFVYIGQLIAYFFLLVLALKELGFSLAGAAIPATVISAAVGLGAQSIIADFLAGFFIISEKQYGVGDWVRFQGSGIDIEGDVIQITMRATTVRTLNGETVIIPNSTARVCINHSNAWARAVALVPVPLLGSSSIQEAIERSTAATRRALSSPEIRDDVMGELDVHPAVKIEKPTVVGMPWMVDMRFMVQVNPAKQWMVERAIRTYILEEFWDEYGSATTTSGQVRDRLMAATKAAQAHSEEASDSAATTESTATSPATSSALMGTDPGEDTARQDTTAAFTAAPTIDVPVSPAPTERAAQRRSMSSRADVSAGFNEPTPSRQGTHYSKLFNRHEYKNAWSRLFSLDGRVRPSTSGLLTALVLLLLFKALTIETGEDWEGSNGVLAPHPAPETTVSSTPTPSPAPAPTPQTSTAPTPSQAVPSDTPTTVQEPTDQAPSPTETATGPTDPAESGGIDTTAPSNAPDEPQAPAPAAPTATTPEPNS